MRCAACSAEIPDVSSFCDACGAAVYPSQPQPLAAVSQNDREFSADARAARRSRAWGWVVGAGLAIAGGAAAWVVAAPPSVGAPALTAAVRRAADQGDGPGRDPICVANGLAYDAEAVNVQASNEETLAWMDTLVTAGLYAPPDDGQSGGFLSQPIRIYRPRPELAEWSGPRRLCVARALMLDSVRNLGPVQPMRFRGVAYPGVAADVVWSLDGPAPWLAAPGVAAAFVNELPTWRGARWRLTPSGWRLTQRKHFFLSGSQWVTGETLERIAGLQAPTAPASAL